MLIEPPRRRRRWPVVLAATLVLLVLVAVAGLWAFDRSLDRRAVDGLAEADDPEWDPDQPEVEAPSPEELDRSVNVLVAGSDDRSVLSPEERREYSTGFAEGERTEVLMLVRLDPETERVDALRFPRDLLVERCDGTRGRINAAYAIGEREWDDGPSCLVRTVTRLTGLPVHHVAKVDFRGFVDLVEAVDGVEVHLEEPLRDRSAGIDLPAGCVELDGADALGFVRARQVDDDFGRIGRQQQLLAAVIDQVVTPSTLANPRRAGSLLATAQRSLEMDDGLTAGRLRSMAATVADLGADDLVTRTVTGETRSSNGNAFLEADADYADHLFTAFDAGRLDETAESPQELRQRRSRDGDGSRHQGGEDHESGGDGDGQDDVEHDAAGGDEEGVEPGDAPESADSGDAQRC